MAGRDQAARILRADGEDDSNAARVVPLAEEPAARGPAEAPAHEQPTETPAAAKPAAPQSPRKKRVLLGIGALAAIAAVYFGVNYYLVGRFMVSTDDAYVRANNSTLGARVSGHIAQIVPGDNTEVKAGQVLFKIDDGDYKISVDAAKRKIDTQQATIERIGRQVEAQQSSVAQAQAQLASADAAANRASLEFDRQETLSKQGFASRSVYETSQSNRDQTAAAVKAAKAAVDSATSAVEVTKAQQAEARAQLQELQSSLDKAERDLAFTDVKAPVDGIFSNRMVNLGDFITTGQRLANIVPLDDVYVDANFKETQLRRLMPGQPVSIQLDADTSRVIDGTVESLSPAAGQVFTLLPPDNATGNFTKIVQRVPVRVRVPADVAKQNILRAGMSVYVRINTKPDAKPAQ
ncbi:HlyD family secretion protein [Tardiphaga alba]|uniref:HlyD family secretion protein n=1 Tax=Tardiphaga alba TaxID=340268 RepID=A0ABX8AAY5_9BRAD|nr:HlyD family secretion protein [Tardiphaga alba]QUS38960.1 HlyD family secretion protein [Tardiphaga alba]